MSEELKGRTDDAEREEPVESEPSESPTAGQKQPEGATFQVDLKGSPVEDLGRMSIVPGILNLGSPSVPEKDAFQEWITRLTPEELNNYDKIGYHLKLLRSILETPDIIALPGEEVSAEKVSHEEIILIMKEIMYYAEEFQGKEKEYQALWPVREFRTFYRALHDLRGKLGNDEGDLAFNKTLRDYLPEIFKHLASSKTDTDAKMELVEKVQTKMSLNERDVMTLGLTLETLKTMHRGIKEGEHADPAVLESVLEGLQEIEVLRREFTEGHDRFGLAEVEKVMDSIPNWELLIVEASESAHNEEQKRNLLNARAHVLNMAIQHIAPMVMKRHRGIIRKRLRNYKKLEEVVRSIDNTQMSEAVKLLLGQISKILSYLDFMWEMHEVTDDKYNKRIVYPQRMLRIAPLISREMERLAAAFEWLAEVKRKPRHSRMESLHSEFPLAEDLNEQSQPGFVLPKSDVDTVGKLADEFAGILDSVFDLPDTEDKPEVKDEDPDTKLAQQLDGMAMLTTSALAEAKKCMNQTKPAAIEVVRGYSDPRITVKDEEPGLTHQIQDFMSEVRGSMMRAIVEIANTFDENQHLQRDILPEYQEYEDQAANLRIELAKVKKESDEAKRVLDLLHVKEPTQADTAVLVLQAKNSLIGIAESLRKFQKQQDQDLAEQKYAGVLKGQHYDLMNGFIGTVKEFFFERECNKIDAHALALYTLTKGFESMAQTIMRAQTSPTPDERIQEWMNEYTALHKIQAKVQRGHMNGGVKKELETEYRDQYMKLVKITRLMAQSESAEEESQTPDEVKNRFAQFLGDNPFAERVEAVHFSKEFYAFQKVMTQFTNFHMLVNSNGDLLDQTLLSEHDNRLAQNVSGHISTIVEELSSDHQNAHQSQRITAALTECNVALEHLRLCAPDIAQELQLALTYLTGFTDYMGHYKEDVRKDDLQSVKAVLAQTKVSIEERFRLAA